MKRRGAMSIELKVGLLFFLSLGLLVWFSLTISQIGGGNGDYAILFPAISRVKEGDPITYNGVRVGTVRATDLVDHHGVSMVRVGFHLDKDQAALVRIDDRTTVRILLPALGGASVEISSSGGKPITPQSALTLRGQSAAEIGDVVVSVQDLIEENREELKQAITAVKVGLTELGEASKTIRVILTENQENLGSAIREVASAAAQVRQAIQENRPELARAISNTASAAASITAAIEENRENLQSALRNAASAGASITTIIEENRVDLRTTMKGAADLGSRLGRIGQNIDELMAQLNSGTGSLGRFIKEDTAHDKAIAAIESFQQRLEEVKPITSGLSELKLYGGVDSGLDIDSQVITSHAYLRIEPRPWKFYQFGVGYRSAGERAVVADDPEKLPVDFDLLVGWRFLPDDVDQTYRLTLAGGLIDSKLGMTMSAPLVTDRLSLHVMARDKHTGFPSNDRRFEDGNVMVRAWIAYRPFSRIEIRAGGNDLVDEPAAWIGLSAEILDNDLRNITAGASLAK